MATIDLSGKHVLLDTNVLSRINSQKEAFGKLLEILSGSIVHYSEATEFELVRNADSDDNARKITESLSVYGRLPITAASWSEATFLANIYSKAKVGKDISPVDCLNAAIVFDGVIVKGEEWCLITIDFYDYPIKYFDWVDFLPIDGKGQNPVVIGFLSPNKQKLIDAYKKWKGLAND
jgi:predicted nucleic acid-binding protein